MLKISLYRNIALAQKAVKIAKSTSFEDALSELQGIGKTLETGDQPLNASLTQFERGVALMCFCQQSLATAEQKIQVLSIGDGEESLDEFDSASE